MNRAKRRWPWGAGPAPPLRCHACDHIIGKRRFHCMISAHRLLCVRCLEYRHLHGRYYPDCDVPWHDLHDHGVLFATRAAAWFVITGRIDWPSQRRVGTR
jgi:hypothetical protein